jgi:hypothetical protein
LIYGDERLIGAFDWDNIGRSFDAVKLRYEQDAFWVDAFAGRVVIPNDNEFDQPNWDDWFWGVYGSSRSLVQKAEVQLYFLGDNANANSQKHATTYGKGIHPGISTPSARVSKPSRASLTVGTSTANSPVNSAILNTPRTRPA